MCLLPSIRERGSISSWRHRAGLPTWMMENGRIQPDAIVRSLMRNSPIYLSACTLVVLTYSIPFAKVTGKGEGGYWYEIDALEWEIGVPRTWIRYIRLTRVAGWVPPVEDLIVPELLTRRLIFRPAGVVPSFVFAFLAGCVLYGFLVLAARWMGHPLPSVARRLLITASSGALFGAVVNVLDPSRVDCCGAAVWIPAVLLLVGLPMIVILAAWKYMSVRTVIVLSAAAWMSVAWGRRMPDFFLQGEPLFLNRFYLSEDLIFPVCGYLITTGPLLSLIILAKRARRLLAGKAS